MTSEEKYMKMLRIEPYEDRCEIPVFPQMIVSFASFAGMTQAETLNDVDKWIEAIEKSLPIIGKPDVCMPFSPGDTVFTTGLPACLPGRELGDNELYQFIEAPYFEDPQEYQRIYDMGWQDWYREYMKRIQKPPLETGEELDRRFALVGENGEKTKQCIKRMGMVTSFDVGTKPIFDTLSLIRSFGEFVCDLYDDPGPIMDIIRRYQPIMDAQTIARTKASGGTRVCQFVTRSSSAFVSPDMFKEYVWPSFKNTIDQMWQAGIYTIVHADSDWLPMLEYFKTVPRGSCHIELDGYTDMAAAYERLEGWQSVRGDVPASMLAYGTPDQVSEYCEKLIRMGMKGGFMLGSGCEVPINARVENVKAMIDSVR